MRVRERAAGTPRVVVLEDVGLGYSVAAALATGGFDVVAARTAARAWRAIARKPPALVVLDARMSDAAIRIVTRLRVSGSSVPALVVCARGEPHVVSALEAGADDCVSPPYVAAELNARARALLRRAYGPADWEPMPIRIGRLVVCPLSREASRDGVPVRLSPKEHGLLLALLESPRRALGRGELLARVWPERAVPNGRTVDTHIAWLRQKIEVDHTRPQIILTVQSVGYLIATPRE
jgi:two-component system KDP operon response regulator KdpE